MDKEPNPLKELLSKHRRGRPKVFASVPVIMLTPKVSIPGSNLRIPESEKPLVPEFLKPLPKDVEDSTTKAPAAWFAYIQAVISKNPHYKYLQRTRCALSRGWQYWFLDTKRNVTIIITKDEISRKVKT